MNGHKKLIFSQDGKGLGSLPFGQSSQPFHPSKKYIFYFIHLCLGESSPYLKLYLF